MRLQTYILFLAATGWRAQEALSIRFKDIDWKVVTSSRKIMYVTEPFEPDTYFFSTGRFDRKTTPEGLYWTVVTEFVKVLDMCGLSDCYDFKGKRHKITLHSFRRFVKSTISDLGHFDFSEWFIGHAASTYYRKTGKEKLDIFRKIEPYLTFLDYSSLEADGADIQSKLEDRDKQILELKEMLEWHEIKRRETQEVLSSMKGEMKDVRDFIENLQVKRVWTEKGLLDVFSRKKEGA